MSGMSGCDLNYRFVIEIVNKCCVLNEMINLEDNLMRVIGFSVFGMVGLYFHMFGYGEARDSVIGVAP